MRGFVVFFCYWAVSSAYILRQEKDEEWKTRKTLQNKAYTTERRERTARKTIWTQNLKVRDETVILVTHFYFLLFQWRCTFNLAHIYEKRREDYVAKVRITFKTISDEKQIYNEATTTGQASRPSIHVAAVQLPAEIWAVLYRAVQMNVAAFPFCSKILFWVEKFQ